MDYLEEFHFNDYDVLSPANRATDPEVGVYGRLEVQLNKMIHKINDIIEKVNEIDNREFLGQ